MISVDPNALRRRAGFAPRDAIVNSQPHGSTFLGKAVTEIDRKGDGRVWTVSPKQ